MADFKDELTKTFGFMIAQEFMKAAPKNTGTLARSFPGTMKAENDVISFNLPNYFPHVEFGTLPHIIRPKNKKALFWKGAEHPMKLVHHPGTKPNPFVRNTINTKTEEILRKSLSVLEKRNIRL